MSIGRLVLKADEATVLRVREVLAKAATRGTDAVRALDELGLLCFDGLRRQLAADALDAAADTLYETTTKQLSILADDRRAQTPLDTKRHVEMWLRSQAKLLRETP